MPSSLSELSDIANAGFRGDGDCGDIAFLANPKYLNELNTTAASAVIVSPSIAKDCGVDNLLVSQNPYLAFALVSRHFAAQSRQLKKGVHASAVIAESARVSAQAYIGPNAVIGANCIIDDGVQINAGTVIGDNCVIGSNSLLAANVTLYENTRIGSHCILHSGCVIGADGFGFANDDGRWVKVPQTGGVMIGNHVEIGANTTIDCGAINDTVIADGVKLDNLIQVAHNVVIGKNTAIAGATAIAGSTRIGESCTIAGGCGIVGHIEIENNAHVSAMTLVSKSVKAGEHVTGSLPAMAHAQWRKNLSRLKSLDELARKIKTLESGSGDREN